MHDQVIEKRRGCGPFVGIGCGSVLLLMVIGGYFVYQSVKDVIVEMTEEYTFTEPLELPTVAVSDEEAKAVLERTAVFATALQQNSKTAPLVLTGRDINILIQKHPDWKECSGKVYVKIEDDKVHGQTSIPLDELGGMFSGRYLNGAAVFSVAMTAGRLIVFIESVDVGGEPLPEEIMTSLRAENLADELNADPDIMEIIKRVESISVRDGKLSIVPKID